jgi:hypothetical protein
MISLVLVVWFMLGLLLRVIVFVIMIIVFVISLAITIIVLWRRAWSRRSCGEIKFMIV